MKRLLAIDQGTTSSRAIVYDENLLPLASAQKEFAQYFPRPGRVEQDADEIWQSVLATSRAAVEESGVPCALGITNQRETVLLWDRSTGKPLSRAIVWQDRRTDEYVSSLRVDGREELIRGKTGLLLDPYFSASKLHWLLREIPDARARAGAGELAAGTVDSWLIYKLTGGREHITDVTNASRTMLVNIHTGDWDPELLSLFDIPRSILPRIAPTSGFFGDTEPEYFGQSIPISAAVGDQQSALFGQLCLSPGMVKCTYGTGCFMLMFTGSEVPASTNRLISTVAWKIGGAPMQYALEGSVFVGGAAIQWLRDGLGIIRSAPEVNKLAASVPDTGGVVLVPAFTGLGAPHWDSGARGALLGISRGTTAAHIARATLEGIAWQVTELLAAMQKDSGRRLETLRVDGGASASDLLMQIQADSLGTEVQRPRNLETTALGAAMMAGLGAGIWKHPGELANIRQVDRVFRPAIPRKERTAKLKLWRRAVKRAQRWQTN